MSFNNKKVPIQYSCYFTRSSAGEQFVPEHAISYIISGSLELNDGKSTGTFKAGDLYFCRRNSLMKYTKYPPEGGEFKSISIFFDQEILRNFSMEFGHSSEKQVQAPAFLTLPTASLLHGYMGSLKAYESIFQEKTDQELIAIKQKEAVLLLLKSDPKIANTLFDFSEPGKIDLEAFMSKNYHFNVALNKFAYLSGRSLSTFKRDFEKIFQTTPSKWLLKRRLQEAYYLIKEQQKMASEIYLSLGFEDLSHFSYAFKKQFGAAPSYI
jgi:AraC-like DNA-binding protein